MERSALGCFTNIGANVALLNTDRQMSALLCSRRDCSIHAQVDNHFNQERNLTAAKTANKDVQPR